MTVQIRVIAITPDNVDATIGIFVNGTLESNWLNNKALTVRRQLINFAEGQNIIYDIDIPLKDIKFIDTGVWCPPYNKWRTQLIINDQIVIQSGELDRTKSGLYDFGEITIPEPLTPEEIEEREKTTPPLTTTAPRTVTATPEEIPDEVNVNAMDIPAPFGFLRPILEFFNGWFKGLSKWQEDRAIQTDNTNKVMQDFAKSQREDNNSFFGNVTGFIQDPTGFMQKVVQGGIQGVVNSKDQIIQESEKEIILTSIKEEQFKSPEMRASIKKMREQMTGTPDTITDFLTSIFIDPMKAIFDSVETFLLPTPPVNFDKANEARKRLFALTIDFVVLTSLLDVVATAVSITVIRNIAQYARNFVIMFNFGDLINLITKPSLDIAISKPLERGFNKRFQPNRLGVSEAINIVVKELETVEKFKARMLELGYPEAESQLIWDGHFIAPVLQQILISWRRGVIDEKRVNELFVLVDLDPRFNEIWETLKYDDPSITQARFMFEVGAIDKAGVKEIIKRGGYVPEFVDALTGWVTGMQARIWRRRYLLRLAQGYIQDIFTGEELKKEVIAAHYTEEVADWIIKDADLRKKLLSAKPKTSKHKTITPSTILSLLTEGRIEETEAEIRLHDLGYRTDDVKIMISRALEQQAESYQEGHRVRLLGKADIQKALKNELRDEQWARTKLEALGYVKEDVNLLILFAGEPEEKEGE